MDVARILKKISVLNSHIQNSLVIKGSQLTPFINSSTNVQNLLKAAIYIEKSADHVNSAKVRLARLIDSHIGHIVGLIDRGQADKAKEYLDVIRPQGWEQNADRNIDKLYEQVVRGLAEKLDPEAFQSLGL
jgi:hypothetical protein